MTIKRLAVNKLYGFLPTTHSSLHVSTNAPVRNIGGGRLGDGGKGGQIRWSKMFTKLGNKNAMKRIKGKIPRELTKTSMTLPRIFIPCASMVRKAIVGFCFESHCHIRQSELFIIS